MGPVLEVDAHLRGEKTRVWFVVVMEKITVCGDDDVDKIKTTKKPQKVEKPPKKHPKNPSESPKRAPTLMTLRHIETSCLELVQ